jgi:hypothetical protein
LSVQGAKREILTPSMFLKELFKDGKPKKDLKGSKEFSMFVLL